MQQMSAFAAPRLLLVFGIVVASRCQGASPSPISEKAQRHIKAVVATLNDILTSITAENKTESNNFKQFELWCIKETKGASYAIEKAQNETADNEVTTKEINARIAALQLSLADTKREITEGQDLLSKSQNLRDDDRSKYEEEYMLNRQSAKQLEESIKIVGKVHQQGGFLQNGMVRRIQLNAPGESNYVLGVMKGLLDRMNDNAKKIEAAEKDKATKHENLAKVRTSQISLLQDKVIVDENKLSEAEVELVEAQRVRGKLEKRLPELQALLEETTRMCDDKKQLYKERVKDRKAEIKAIGEAIAYIEKASTKGAPAGMTPNSKEAQEKGEENFLVAKNADKQGGAGVVPNSGLKDVMHDVAALSFLQQQAVTRQGASDANDLFGGSLSGSALGQADAALSGLATSVGAQNKKEAFTAAMTVVKNLIQVLEKEQVAEEEKVKLCNKDIEKTDDENQNLLASVKQLSAAIDSMKATIDVTKAELKEITTSQEKLKTALEDAGKLRKEQKNIYTSGSKDRLLAIKVLNQAKQVLGEFYHKEGMSLAQIVDSALPKAAPKVSVGGRKGVQAGGAISLLDDIANTIMKEEKDAKIEEEKAEAEYEKLQEDTRNEVDRLWQEVIQRNKLKAKTMVQLSSQNDDLSKGKEDQENIAAQLLDLHKSCDKVIEFHDSRTKAREFELNQLRDVLDILAGSSVAARTGFLENPFGDAISDSERALMQDMSNTATSLKQTAAAFAG